MTTTTRGVGLDPTTAGTARDLTLLLAGSAWPC